MKITIRRFAVLDLMMFAGVASLLCSSEITAATVQANYSLIEVNGSPLPAVSWRTQGNGERCEYLTFGGALILSANGRSGAFAMERVNCIKDDGSETSKINDFVMFSSEYEISGTEVTFSYDDGSTDHGYVQGDLLSIKVVGIFEYEGQVTEYTFEQF